MAVYYDFYANPIPPHSNRNPRLHARVVSRGTVSTKELASMIHDSTTLSEADVKGTLAALTHALTRCLHQGYKVQIEGLGNFELTLSCPPVRYPDQIRAESVRFKSVVFRPENEWKEELQSITLERAKEKRHSKTLSTAEVDQRLTQFFASHDTLTRERFASLCGFIRCTACRRLQRLVEEGKLLKAGVKYAPHYLPANNHYRPQ